MLKLTHYWRFIIVMEKFTKSLFWVENDKLNKKGLDISDFQELIAYTINEKGQPIKEIGRIKL